MSDDPFIYGPAAEREVLIADAGKLRDLNVALSQEVAALKAERERWEADRDDIAARLAVTGRDTARLDWMEARKDVFIKYYKGCERPWMVETSSRLLGFGDADTIREAIDAMRQSQREQEQGDEDDIAAGLDAKQRTSSVRPPALPGDLVWGESSGGPTPVIAGTGITANSIIDKIIDGHTWSNILASHPVLNESDIRACLLWATSEDAGLDMGEGGETR